MLEQKVDRSVGEREREGLRDNVGEVENDVDTVGDTLCTREREALELVLED